MKRPPPTASRVAEALGLQLPPGAEGRLRSFEGLLRNRAVPLGMVAAADEPRVWERHVLDCLRAASVAPEGGRAFDLGSGAGLPGIVVAIARPAVGVDLVEARRRRAAFLEFAVSELGVGNARVVESRAEDLAEGLAGEQAGGADVCFARALAPLRRAWALARPLLRPGGRLVYFAGQSERPSPPEGARSFEVVATSVLARSGPLVIMGQR